MRSKLFVPGVRPELFAKALASEADALSFDLEDSVPEDRKAQARANVVSFLATPAVRATAKTIVVRTNALATPHCIADIEALASAGVGLFNLPKVESRDEALAAVELLQRSEAQSGTAATTRLLLTIETPGGLRNAAGIAAAHPRVAGLQLGLGDLFEPFGIDRRDRANVHAVMHAVRMAAAEAGIFACDGAFGDLEDADGFVAEARMARRLGYAGKSCIHPRQLGLANQVFQPTDEEVATARRIVAAARTAAADGRGAFVVDGRMIDAPFLKRAEAIIAAAAR
ncbi:HpcH/HpaI aldolase/citrate lyase family protein [Pseudoxanthomonas wuyuanensis]|uniref:Citrate lyase subunit beta / citryl-CoA lyase n=1 Tax=Pseudoxanthomonas wuyuanensis TaxID=1073196 RepID=A0A286D6I1_9GAMM|nr:CoA ester lyase [Pseudoxanthomonas wuyuanensis]KAF1721478.1 CoA ester lyase [Pseudoxanthomonas wuyuanensis]SOD54263.1 citrate lyase subunit beta / citryl-CoA lyase [Pseudoxanthomonas wuyuanensis]